MEDMGLKILVTGGTGFIGSNLIKALLHKECVVYALIRGKNKIENNRINNLDKLNYVRSHDLFNKRTNNHELPRFDVCIHLAAYGVDHQQNDLYEIIDGNIKYTVNLLEFCKNNRTKKIINTGSCFEYGPNEGKKLRENDILNPNSYYAVTKMASEKIAHIFSKNNNLNLITVRPFGVFGEGEGFHRFVPQVMRAIKYQRTMELTKGEQIRDYLYIKDLIDAYIALAKTDVPPNEAYNICSSREISIKEMTLKAVEVLKSSAGLFNFGASDYRENEVMYFVGDNSKIKKYTNWQPKYTLEEGLRQTYEWYNLELKDMP